MEVRKLLPDDDTGALGSRFVLLCLDGDAGPSSPSSASNNALANPELLGGAGISELPWLFVLRGELPAADSVPLLVLVVQHPRSSSSAR